MQYTIGIDLGGTNIAVGLVNEKYEIVSRAGCPTALPRPAAEVEADMARLCRQLVADAGLDMTDIAWVGIGTPGSVDPETGFVGFNANFAYHDWHLAADMQALLDRPIFIENDANAAAWGEYAAGALQGSRCAVAITLGTGIGAGIILDGRLYSGFNHSGGELGHMVIVKDGRPCMCGRNGCWEKYASASALVADTKEAMRAHPHNRMWDMVGRDPEKVNGRTAFDAMRAGDAVAKKVVDSYLEYVACGITNLINIFQPEVLCIGGGVSREGETILAPIRNYVDTEEYARGGQKRTRIVTAKLFNDAGIVGAAMLGRQQTP